MKIAAVARPRDPLSARVYRESVSRELAPLGAEVAPVAPGGPVPSGCEVLWDPAMGMQGPAGIVRGASLPVVVTVHGLEGFWLPVYESAANWKLLLLLAGRQLRVRWDWRWLRRRVAAVITPSVFGADEAADVLRLPRSAVHAVHHGIDVDAFGPDGPARPAERPYFFLVAQYQPCKNIRRLLRAYARLPQAGRPDLLALLPGYPRGTHDIAGVSILREPLPPEDLPAFYRGATAFVLPSLHETFCMPMLEAMACGCPVIASRGTAMPEVAGDAAILVDPRSVDDIAAALRRLADDDALRRDLRRRGLERAKQFTWRRCAERHLDVFRRVMEGRT